MGDRRCCSGRALTNPAQHLQAEPWLSASPSAVTVSQFNKNKIQNQTKMQIVVALAEPVRAWQPLSAAAAS